VKCVEALIWKRGFQKLWEFRECPAAKVFECGPCEKSGGGVEIHDPKTPPILRVFEMQYDDPHRQAAEYL